MPVSSKRILLSYLQLSNIGCEIIMRGTIAFLRNRFPHEKLEFIVPSYHVKRDRELLSDIEGVRIIPMLKRKRVIRGILRKLGLFPKIWTPRFSSFEFRNTDLFVSVGGDIYTMFGKSLPLDWIGYEKYATKHGIPSIMFGANMERFEILSNTDRATLLEHLKRFKAIVVRDLGTVDYLSSMGIKDNVAFHPDPCFLLHPDPVFRRTPVQKIAINYSPIIWREFGEVGLQRFKALTEGLVASGYEVRFVPHVYSSDDNEGLSDPHALKRLHGILTPEVRAKVNMVEPPYSFKTIEHEISKADLFIGGRMHGCLNALTQGKAVCFVGYSKKVLTMVNWLSTDSPYSIVANSYGAVPADQLDLNWVEQLISAHDGWAASGPDVKIDMETYLAGLTARSFVSSAISLRETQS